MPKDWKNPLFHVIKQGPMPKRVKKKQNKKDSFKSDPKQSDSEDFASRQTPKTDKNPPSLNLPTVAHKTHSLPTIRKTTNNTLSRSPQTPAVTSALQNYIHFISRFPLLSKEEEYDLAVEYYERKTPQAAEKLVQSNLRFVVKVVGKYGKFSSKIMDLIQEGNLGLMKAVKEFNPYKGVRLITYAVWWIKGYIQEFLIRQHSIVRIGTNKKEKALYYLLQREKEALDQATQTKLLPEISRYHKNTA